MTINFTLSYKVCKNFQPIWKLSVECCHCFKAVCERPAKVISGLKLSGIQGLISQSKNMPCVRLFLHHFLAKIFGDSQIKCFSWRSVDCILVIFGQKFEDWRWWKGSLFEKSTPDEQPKDVNHHAMPCYIKLLFSFVTKVTKKWKLLMHKTEEKCKLFYFVYTWIQQRKFLKR